MGKRKRRAGKKTRKKSWIFSVFFSLLFPVCYGCFLFLEERMPVQTAGGSNAAWKGKELGVDELAVPVERKPELSKVVAHEGYTVSFNSRWRIPNWVSYELTGAETRGKEERTNHFTEDPALPGLTADNRDYYRSGYDRGHMAPAADMKWSKASMKESFYYSNICPQHRLLNQRKWNDLEEQIRKWAVADSALIVICGPVVESATPKTIGKNKVVVPDAFFKVVLAPYARQPKAIAFLFKNAKATRELTSYVVSIDSVESVTGLDFFAALPDALEAELESGNNSAQWVFN